MPGPDRRRPPAGPTRSAHPLRKAVPVAPAKGAPTVPAEVAPPAAKSRPLDGTGTPYITLAQFLKWKNLAETGGAAKVLARTGGIRVNGTPEERPGRKLHDGDQVEIGGDSYRVDVTA